MNCKFSYHCGCRHAGHLKSYDQWCKLNDKRKRAQNNDEDVPVVSKSVQLTLPGHYMNQPRKLTQSMLDTFIVDYIAESILPFNHVESDAFRNFVDNLLGTSAKQVQIKTRKVYRNQMKNLFDSKKAQLIQSMQCASSVCLTADHWSARSKGYLGITAHWFAKNKGSIERKQAGIALRRMIGRCTYDSIGRLMESVMAEFGINNKVSHCVTDSGSNFVKALKEFRVSEEIGSNEHEEQPSEDGEEQMQPVAIAEALEAGPEEDDERYDLPRHFRCAAHRLNLVATGRAVDDTLANPRCKTIHRNLMRKLTTLWNKQSRSTVTADNIKEKMGIMFVAPNSTRWNSTYDALVRVKRMLTEKKTELQSLFTSENLRPLTDTEDKFLNEFLMVFKPLACALDVLQGEDNACAGYLLPTLQAVIEEWKDVGSSEDLEYCNGLLCAVNAELKRRFEGELNSNYFMVAAAIHPKFKLSWIWESDSKAKVRDLVKLALENTAGVNPSVDNAGSGAGSLQSEPSTSSDNSFFWRMEKRRSLVASSTSSQYDRWLSWTESQDASLPEYLQELYMMYNTTLPSSAPVERLFSLSKRVLSPSRSLLADDAFEMCVFIPALKKAGF